MHRNILSSIISLSIHGILLPETRLWYFWHQDSHKQLFLKGEKRKLPTQKINAVDYSESNAEAVDRKWKEQIVSNVNIIVPLQHSSCPHTHTLYLTKTMDKATGIGRWLSRRKWMIFIFPTFLIFPFMHYSCKCLIPEGHINIRMTGYLLCFLLSHFWPMLGLLKKFLIWHFAYAGVNFLFHKLIDFCKLPFRSEVCPTTTTFTVPFSPAFYSHRDVNSWSELINSTLASTF